MARHLSHLATYKALESLRPRKRRKMEDLECEWYRWFDMHDITISLSRLFWPPGLDWPPGIQQLFEPGPSIIDKRELMNEDYDTGHPDTPYEASLTQADLFKSIMSKACFIGCIRLTSIIVFTHQFSLVYKGWTRLKEMLNTRRPIWSLWPEKTA